MVDRRLVHEDDSSRIGLRIKAARVLTSFNQEEFAEKYGFGYASVKNWELGRSIPRNETFAKIVSSLSNSGVQVTRDWLLYGSGSGPTHSEGSSEHVSSESTGFKPEIVEFERWCKQNKHRSLIAMVADEAMMPFYAEGDFIGAVELDIKDYRAYREAIAKEVSAPFLVEIEAGNYQPRFLRYDKSGLLRWFQAQQDKLVGDLNFNGLGKIMWVRKAF